MSDEQPDDGHFEFRSDKPFVPRQMVQPDEDTAARISSDDPHFVGTVRCRMCNHEHVSVWPANIVDEDAQECPNCGHMTCGPVEDDDEDQV